MKYNTIILLASVLLLASCQKDYAPSAELKVTTDKTEYRVGEPVTFRFSGDPDNIVFYSGEYGHNYADKDNYSRVGTLLFDFTSWVRWGAPEIMQNIEVLVSTDFDGVYELENVEGADWLELDGAVLSSGEDRTPSGIQNINDILADNGITVSPDDDIYIAFHYFDYQDEVRTGQDQWILRSVNLDLVAPDGEKTNIATMANIGWTRIPDDGSVVNVSSSQVLFNDEDETIPSRSNSWIISPAFSIGGIPADTGVAIKGIDTDMSEYTYTYNEPGTYTAVFATSSIWYTGGSSSTAEVTVTVLPAE